MQTKASTALSPQFRAWLKKQPRRPRGWGSVVVSVDTRGRVTFKPKLTVRGVTVWGTGVSVKKIPGLRPLACEQDAYLAAEANRSRLLHAVAQGPSPATGTTPQGREFVRVSDPAFRRWIWERDGGVCALCDRPVPLEGLHVDHIRPRIEGGDDAVGNLRISHPACNLRRGAHRHLYLRR